MSESIILKISRLISQNSETNTISLEDIDYALENLISMLNKEKTRKTQIKIELKLQENNTSILEKLSEISFLEEHLEKSIENIKNLENYIEILNTKRLVSEFKDNTYSQKIAENIDFKNSYLYS